MFEYYKKNSKIENQLRYLNLVSAKLFIGQFEMKMLVAGSLDNCV